MSMRGFVMASRYALRRRGRLESIYATVEQQGENFIVTDRQGDERVFSTAFLAAMTWHSINMLGMRRDFMWPHSA